MATKLDAFLAVVPANSSASSPPKSAPASLVSPQLELKTVSENITSLARTEPQPSMVRHRCSSSQRSCNSSFKLALNNDTSNQEQDRPEDDRGVARPSPLKSFMAAQAAAAKAKFNEEKRALSTQDLARIVTGTELDATSEAGPMRMASIQGSHHRRVSTDTTLFNRYMRHQEDVDIDQKIVQHFSSVPVITATLAVTDALESEMSVDNNVNDEFMTFPERGLGPEDISSLFRLGSTIPVSCALEIVRKATNLMSLEQNVVSICAPYTLVGDLHGQFQDLLELFRVHGFPADDNPFLFLGDYVDRGIASCEIILLLLAYKVALPNSVHLLRGNHECRSLSTFYGFRAECLKKYGPVVYNRMIKCFESMPLAAQLETAHGTFLAVHGGLSPDISFVDDINGQVNRFMEPEPNGALCDLLWSDPAKGEAQEQMWLPNGTRGCSFTFNELACRDFLKRNHLLAIIRAHELEEDGFKEHFCHDVERIQDEVVEKLILPAVVTVFSAPEYCNTNHNVGATLKIPWEKQNGRLLLYQQHKRSQYSEFEFTRSCEEEAVKAFLKENLPFVPIDFYELVSVCRHLRSSLEHAPLSGTEPSRNQSLVSSLCDPAASNGNKIEKGNLELLIPSERVDELELKEDVLSATESNEDVESLQDWEIVGETASAEVQTEKLKKYGKKKKKERNKQVKEKVEKKKNKQKEKKKWGTSRIVSGWKFCPGFFRFYDRYFARDTFKKSKSEISSAPSGVGVRTTWIKTHFRRSASTGEAATDSETNDMGTDDSGRVRRKTMPDWMAMPSHGSVDHLSTTLQSQVSVQANGVNMFTKAQWQALKLYFSILDLDGSGVLMEESFVVLLAEQDSDAYATEDELSLLMEVMDCNSDSLITEQDFLLFAYRASLRWKKALYNLD